MQDTPYSISVVPAPLIENLQATSLDDIAKVIPQVTNIAPYQNSSGNPFFYLRGFQVTQFTDKAGLTYDGMQGGAGGMFATVLDDKERVEILSGVNGFLYGTGSVGGNINYVLKRPTATPYAAITAGDNAGENGYIHGDFGGPVSIPGLADGLVGYRLNIAGQDGHTSIYGQSVQRDIISAAIDIHLMDGLLLQLNAAHSNYHVYGLTPYFVTSLNPYPVPANPATIVTNSWEQNVDQTDTGGLRLTWKLNDIFTLRTAYEYTSEDRPLFEVYSNIIHNYQGLMTNADPFTSGSTQWYTNSGYSFLDAEFSTFGIQHKMTVGFTGYSQLENEGGPTTRVTDLREPGNFYSQTPVPAPALIYGQQIGHIDAQFFSKNYVLGDEIKFTDQFIILAGANYTSLGNKTFNAKGSGMVTGGYDAAALTPTVSLVYKVLPWFTTYATYQQSLEAGTQVQNSGTAIYTNNGAILPPFIGQQYEVGAKASVGTNLLLTLALFDISKANEYNQLNPNGTFTAVQSGRQVNKGIEFTATGKVWEDLTVVGGFTFLDPRITNDVATPTANGDLAQYVSPLSEKIYVEYNIPFIASLPFLHGLTLIGGFQFANYFYNDLPNTQRVPGYAVADLGFRYTTTVDNKPLIIRFNVNNVGNTAYWQSNLIEGLPRTFLASAEMKF